MWSFEFRMGLGWAVLITVLMLASLSLTRQIGNIAPFLIPIIAFVGFVAWVNRVN